MEELQRQRALLVQQGQRTAEYNNERVELEGLYKAVVQLQRERWDADSKDLFIRTYPEASTGELSFASFSYENWSSLWCTMVAAKIRRDSDSYQKFLEAHDALKKKYQLPPGTCSCWLCKPHECEIEAFRPGIDEPLLPKERTKWRTHPRFASAYESCTPLFATGVLILGPECLYFYVILESPATPTWVHCCAGILAGILVAGIAVADFAMHEPSETFLKLCRESGVQGWRPRGRFECAESFLWPILTVFALFMWPWPIVLVTETLAAAFFWRRRYIIYDDVRNTCDLNDTVAQLGTIDKWPTYDQVFLSDTRDGAGQEKEKEENDFLVVNME